MLSKEFLRKNLIYIIFAIVMILVFVSFVLIDSFTKKPGVFNQPDANSLPRVGVPHQVITAEAEKQDAKDLKISQMINKLPYKADNFYFDYHYSTFQFVLTVYKPTQDDGLTAFDQFLLDNGVESRDWLKNLIVRIQ